MSASAITSCLAQLCTLSSIPPFCAVRWVVLTLRRSQLSEDQEFVLFSVKLFKRFVDDFKNAAREKRYVASCPKHYTYVNATQRCPLRIQCDPRAASLCVSTPQRRQVTATTKSSGGSCSRTRRRWKRSWRAGAGRTLRRRSSLGCTSRPSASLSSRCCATVCQSTSVASSCRSVCCVQSATCCVFSFYLSLSHSLLCAATHVHLLCIDQEVERQAAAGGARSDVQEPGRADDELRGEHQWGGGVLSLRVASDQPRRQTLLIARMC